MMYEDGNPTLSWFKKSFRDHDKYMSKLVNCNKVILLNTHMYITLIYANTLFICTCRFLSL